MKILCIKDHVRSSINNFRERIRAITNPNTGNFIEPRCVRITEVQLYLTNQETYH